MKSSTFVLSAYLWLTAFSTPALLWQQKRRLAQGKELADRMQERLGVASREREPGQLVWFHAASVGETLSLISLIRKLLSGDPKLRVLVTSTTVTSARLLSEILPQGAIHQFSPFETRSAVRTFLDHWRPDLAVWTESELWPRLLSETYRRDIPMLLINARVSEKTMVRWRRWSRTAQALLSPFRAILVQEEKSAQVMRDIGVPAELLTVTGSLKEELPPPDVKSEDLTALQGMLGDRPRWLAASTHDSEEDRLASAHLKAFGKGPDAPLLIIAPRHPERGPAIAESLKNRGLRVALRSAAAMPDALTDVYVADTIGEMGLWYRICRVAFIGGSLARIGGHNPYEPIQLDCAILHGPHVTNFAEIYARLAKAGAALLAETEDEIVAGLGMVQDEQRRADMASAARTVLNLEVSATGQAMAKINELLAPRGAA